MSWMKEVAMHQYAAAAALGCVSSLAFAGKPVSVEEAPQVVRDAIAQGALICEQRETMGSRLKPVTLCRFVAYPQMRQLLLTDTGFVEYRQNEFHPGG